MTDFNNMLQLVLISGYNFGGGLEIKPKLRISCWIKLCNGRSYKTLLSLEEFLPAQILNYFTIGQFHAYEHYNAIFIKHNLLLNFNRYAVDLITC